MNATSITGLCRDGEYLQVTAGGAGRWEVGIDAFYYLVWRKSCGPDGAKDLQAHIELARFSDTLFMMETYHSWPIEVTIAGYSVTVTEETPCRLVLTLVPDS